MPFFASGRAIASFANDAWAVRDVDLGHDFRRGTDTARERPRFIKTQFIPFNT